jgi:hypothetical protein
MPFKEHMQTGADPMSPTETKSLNNVCHLITLRVLSYFRKMKHGFHHRLILGPLLFIIDI